MPELENLSSDEKRIIREAFVEAFGKEGSKKRAQVCKQMANAIGTLLRQEKKPYRGRMYLWTLGKPVRPLTALEIAENA